MGKKCIRFINSDCSEKFVISDEDSIRMTMADGTIIDRKCFYIDDSHIQVGGTTYHSRQFAEIMERNGTKVIPLRESLPNMCYVFVESENCVGLVIKGENGYRETAISCAIPDDTRDVVNKMNRGIDVSPAQVEAMKCGSLFGWETPAADPENYDVNGIPKRNKSKEVSR